MKNKIVDDVFKNKVACLERLEEYGFQKNGHMYLYQTKILNGQFNLVIKINANGQVETQVIEDETNEPYTLFLIDDAMGSFVGAVRAEYQQALSDIANKCFERRVFNEEISHQVIEYVLSMYGTELEYLWEKFPDIAVLRRKDTGKWYGVLFVLDKSKLGVDGAGKIEIIDLRMPTQESESRIDNKTVFAGYHMNKKHCVSVLLDGSVNFDEVKSMIDTSYVLAKK